ncbi:hypothetical protein [Hymenobacter aerophilus]|uniref:hypothetical protein n=1 Tax=Hymenobacter aerophilus TaxID=119644 RepID=UPI0008FC1064|nr:hypothetical protein [Hymenobacter aerophilus]
MDDNFWKDAYSASWKQASEKENWIKATIEKETGLAVEVIGLGAGSTDYISGSAALNDKEKGGADLYLPERDIYVEVTGPNINVSADDDLWIRPDKAENAFNKIASEIGKMHVVVHLATIKPTGDKLARVILMTAKLQEDIRNSKIPLITPRIRGNQERYYSIPANYVLVRPYEKFINFLKSIPSV